MEDEKLSKLTGMLLAGGKMLGVHCPTCMGPLFQYRGKTVCAACGEKTGPARTGESKPLEKAEQVLQERINVLAGQLSGETDRTKSMELLEDMKSTLDALGKLKKG